MNPGAIRTAITTGLAARPLWTDVPMYRYPAGKLVERRTGFALGEISDVDSEPLDLACENMQVTYQIDGGLHVGTTGALDDDYESVETAALGLITDFERWLTETDHGKTLPVPDPVVIDQLFLTDWELSFAATAPIAVIGFQLLVVEMVSTT